MANLQCKLLTLHPHLVSIYGRWTWHHVLTLTGLTRAASCRLRHPFDAPCGHVTPYGRVIKFHLNAWDPSLIFHWILWLTLYYSWYTHLKLSGWVVGSCLLTLVDVSWSRGKGCPTRENGYYIGAGRCLLTQIETRVAPHITLPLFPAVPRCSPAAVHPFTSQV